MVLEPDDEGSSITFHSHVAFSLFQWFSFMSSWLIHWWWHLGISLVLAHHGRGSPFTCPSLVACSLLPFDVSYTSLRFMHFLFILLVLLSYPDNVWRISMPLIAFPSFLSFFLRKIPIPSTDDARYTSVQVCFLACGKVTWSEECYGSPTLVTSQMTELTLSKYQTCFVCLIRNLCVVQAIDASWSRPISDHCQRASSSQWPHDGSTSLMARKWNVCFFSIKL